MPNWKTEIQSRLAALHLAPTRETAIIEELAQDLDDCYADCLAHGASATEAYQQTLAELDGSEWLRRELQRSEPYTEPIPLGTNRRSNLMADLWQDLRYGARMLRKQPGFTLIAVLTLALGIGANTAIFSVVYGVLLHPLPYRDAERLVVSNISPPDFRDLKASTQSLDQMALWGSNLYGVNVKNETKQTMGAIVSPEFFPLLGINPALGRYWQADEDTERLAVISYDLWQTRFGAQADVIGQAVRLSGTPHTIIGVMPPEFQYPSSEFKLWVTFGSAMAFAPQQAENRQARFFRAIAHRNADTTMTAMQAEMKGLADRLKAQFPDTNSGSEFNFVSLYDRIVGDVQRALWILLATVGFVLLIACANVANLTLSRAASREREVAVRAALGASRGRVIRQLLTESLLVALVGGALGIGLAQLGIALLLKLNPQNLPRLATLTINYPVLLFALGVTLLTGIVFGLLPAWQASRVSLSQSLKEGGRSNAGSTKSRRLRGGLVVAEIALSLVVLIGAGLLVKSFARLLSVDPGFTTENLLTLNIGFVHFKEPAERIQKQREVLTRIAALPGVQAVGGGTGLPPVTSQRGTRFAVQGLPNDNLNERGGYFIAISPDYFRALSTKVTQGRVFSERDNETSAPVVIINQALAQRLFPHESAVGKRLQLINPEQSKDWREIVGVVGDVTYGGLNDRQTATIYTPFAQTPFLWNYLMIRSAAAPETLVNSVRQAIVSVDEKLEPMNFQPMEQVMYDAVAQPRFYMSLLSAFAVLSLVLAAVGIYGVMAYSVTQRRHELGVRLALGAQRRDVLRLVMREGVALALLGIGIGVAGAYAATKAMTGLLFGVQATDVTTYVAIACLLLLVVLLASFIPALRAMKVDPLVALRTE